MKIALTELVRISYGFPTDLARIRYEFTKGINQLFGR